MDSCQAKPMTRGGYRARRQFTGSSTLKPSARLTRPTSNLIFPVALQRKEPCGSMPYLCSSHDRSSGVKKCAEPGLRARHFHSRNPSTTAGMPSSRNSHCQPLKPPTPSSFSSPAALGPSMTRLTAVAVDIVAYASPSSRSLKNRLMWYHSPVSTPRIVTLSSGCPNYWSCCCPVCCEAVTTQSQDITMLERSAY